jgi:class 3 adenylate cyclase/tetratricopeptide (TPR) repeat protein
VTTCPTCGHANPVGARFCNACSTPLSGAGRPREQRKVVTVLFCDVTGSTELGERLDAEALRALLARYFERMRSIVEGHGGSVEKFIGDAVMAVFGVPAVHEDDAIRALRAAAEMRDAFGELRVGGRIGVATGEVVAGTSERLVTGDAVNVAARLQQAGQPGEIVLSAQTAALAGSAAMVEPLEPLHLKGKTESVEAYRLLAMRADPERGHTSPMIGRTRQRALLQDVFDAVRSDRSCHLFTLIGAAGVGKSRLTADFLATVGNATVVRGRCLSYGEGITYWPVVEILKQLGGRPSEPAAAAAVATLLGESDDPTTPDTIAWATRRTLEEAAERNALICVLDDAHWGEPALLDLIEHIADFSRDAPILLLCIARPELMDRRPTWAGGKLNATTVLLEPLSTQESAALIGQLVADGEIDTVLWQRIAEAAEGNPLFIEEMVAMVVDDTSADLAVPPTIRALLAARLDQLEEPDRIVLERAAVEGQVFHQAALQALTPDEAALPTRLQALIRKDLLRPARSVLAGQDAFRFRHLLIRDAAYDAMPKRLRAELHARFAEWLRIHGTDLVELDEILAYHSEQACIYRAELGLEQDLELRSAAREHLVSAARRTLMREDWRAAAVLLGRASQLDTRDVDAALEVDLASALFDAGDIDAGLRSAAAAAARADDAGDRLGALCLRIQHGLTHVHREPEGATEALERLVNTALPEFEQAGHDLGLFLCTCARGEAALVAGKADTAVQYFDEAYEHARLMNSPHQQALILGSRIAMRKDGSMPADTFLAWLETLPTHARSTDMFVVSQAEAQAMCGHIEQAHETLRRLIRNLEERDATVSLAVVLGLFVPEIELFLGNAQAALDAAARGCELLEQFGENAWRSSAAANLACALYLLDRLDEADAWAQRAAELGSSDDALAQLVWRLVRAKVLARRGAHDAAAHLIAEALAVAHRIEQTNYQAIADMDAAEVYSLAGRAEEARAALERALDLAHRKGNLPMAAHIEELLAA